MTQLKSRQRQLPDELQKQARAIKQRGGTVFLVVGELIGDEGAKLCDNCNGVGELGIQWFTGGPYVQARACESKADPNTGEVPPRMAFYNGKWYYQKTRTDTCPICFGTGLPVWIPARAAAMAF